MSSLHDEIAQMKMENETLKKEVKETQEQVNLLKYGSCDASKAKSVIQRIREGEAEMVKQLDQIKDQVPSEILDQLIAKMDAMGTMLELEKPKTNFVIREASESVWKIHHNFNGGKVDEPFEAMYVHDETVKPGDCFEVRIEDVGEKWSHSKFPYDIGIGVIEMSENSGKNRAEFGFDLGSVSSDAKVLHLLPNDDRKILDCPDRVLIAGDEIRVTVTDAGVVAYKNKKDSTRYHYPNDTGNEYKIVIGMNNRFAKVTLAVNRSFSSMFDGPLHTFPKDDVRIYVTSMNEGSPNYAAGVSKGGMQLLSDGTLLRKIREDGRRVINYQPGSEAVAYDAKLGGDFKLSHLFPGQLVRNRIKLGGNLVSVTRKGDDWFTAVVKSILTGHVVTFEGSDYDWVKQKDCLLSNGEKYLIELPTPNGMIDTSSLLVCGTKCKTINNVIYETLLHKVNDTDKTPAVLLLGGDRSQSVGSVSGAVRAYEDLCVVFFDAHFDFRDPNASEYPIAHGSPLFFLLQDQLRAAIQKWNALDDEAKDLRPKTRDAIRYILSTREGRKYWADLQNPSVGYRGFNWLHDADKLNAHRIAFVGVRQSEQQLGSSLGSPLVTLFLQLLELESCMYTKGKIQAEGVSKVFPRIIEQFRGTFPDEYLKERDAHHPKCKWIPPIMVSWDVDSIDPNDMPCTIFQEPEGLTSEECLAFSDEIANTKSLVLFETIEFNPELWGGYRDEPIKWTINEFEAGPLNRSPRVPSDKNKHRLDLQESTSLIHDMIVRAFKSDVNCVES